MILNQELYGNEMTTRLAIYRFGLGKDISEKLFLELHLIGKKNSSDRVDVEAYELEAVYQSDEQGEHWADWGILLDIQKESESREWEGNIGLLVEKEFGRWSGALNLHQQYFYQNDNQHEWSNNTALQMRYRYQPYFEPGFELYASQGSLAIGPVFLGVVELQNKKLNWELGFIEEIRSDGPNSVIRAIVEFEF